MQKLGAAIVAAAWITSSALAFDNSTCSTYLVGSWGEESDFGDGEIGRAVSDYNADGTFSLRLDREKNGQVKTGKVVQAGLWAAKPGSTANSCSVELKTSDGGNHYELSYVDENTVKRKDRTIRRQK